MEWSPSSEANWFSASQEMPHILWKLKVHYRICNSLPSFHILSQINPVYAPIPLPEDVFILAPHQCLGLQSFLFPSGFPTKTLYAPLLVSIHATCPAPLILLDLIT
jgi:hypothetical protein